MNAIPFTQYLLPDGRRQSIGIERPEHVVVSAQRFIAAGGRYEAEILTIGLVSLTAVFMLNGEEQDIAIELCPNGPDIPRAVDTIVERSVIQLDRRKRAP